MYITLPIHNPEIYNEQVQSDKNWVMYNICNALSGFDFLVLGIKFDDYILIKPYEKVKILEFEALFNFNMGSSDYDENRIICIKKESNPLIFKEFRTTYIPN
jgi:hypothetical protein